VRTAAEACLAIALVGGSITAGHDGVVTLTLQFHMPNLDLQHHEAGRYLHPAYAQLHEYTTLPPTMMAMVLF